MRRCGRAGDTGQDSQASVGGWAGSARVRNEGSAPPRTRSCSQPWPAPHHNTLPTSLGTFRGAGSAAAPTAPNVVLRAGRGGAGSRAGRIEHAALLRGCGRALPSALLCCPAPGSASPLRTCSGVPVTSSLFLKLQEMSSCSSSVEVRARWCVWGGAQQRRAGRGSARGSSATACLVQRGLVVLEPVCFVHHHVGPPGRVGGWSREGWGWGGGVRACMHAARAGGPRLAIPSCKGTAGSRTKEPLSPSPPPPPHPPTPPPPHTQPAPAASRRNPLT